MERFHHRLAERKLPPLDALVVVVAGERQGIPGSGYFRVNGLADPLGDLEAISPEQAQQAWTFWEDQKRECKTWGDKHRRSRGSVL